MLHLVHPADEAALLMSNGALNAIFNPPFLNQPYWPIGYCSTPRASKADIKKSIFFVFLAILILPIDGF
jgi:hypothetical protein